MRRRNGVGQNHNRGGWGTGWPFVDIQLRLRQENLGASSLRWALVRQVGPQDETNRAELHNGDLLGNQKRGAHCPEKVPLPASSCHCHPINAQKEHSPTLTNLGSPTTNHLPPPTLAASECFSGTRWDGETWWDGELSVFQSVSQFGHITLLVGSRVVSSADLVTHRMRKRFAVHSEPSFLRRLCFLNGHLSNRFVCVSLFATRSGGP
jgi:hypothetical protein